MRTVIYFLTAFLLLSFGTKFYAPQYARYLATYFSKRDPHLKRSIFFLGSPSRAIQAGEQELLDAVRTGDEKKVRELIRSGINPNTAAPGGYSYCSKETPLLMAIQAEKLPLVIRLIELGADVNLETIFIETNPRSSLYGYACLPLVQAIKVGDIEIIKALIDAGARTEVNSSWISSPLDVADRYSMKFLMKMFDESLPSSQQPATTKAELLSMVQRSLDAGLADEDKIDLLHWSSKEGVLSLIASAVASGVEVNSRNKLGQTALMTAVAHGQHGAARQLIVLGADVEAENRDHWTALIMAAEHGDWEIAELLLQNGADTEKKDTFGETPLIKSILAPVYHKRDLECRTASVILRAGAVANYGKYDHLPCARAENRQP